MDKRPMAIITICYIISILGGVYLKKYIPFFYLILVGFLIFWVVKKHPAKWFISFCIVLTLISTAIIKNNDDKFCNFDIKSSEFNTICQIIEVRNESEYYYNYTVKVLKYNNQKCNLKMMLMIKKAKGISPPKYADLIQVEGEVSKPEDSRNYKGYSQLNYYKQNKIYGIVKGKNYSILKEKSTNKYNLWINSIRSYIKNSIIQLIPKENVGIACALLIGDNSSITQDEKDIFSSAYLSHILAISGMHVTYVIIGIGVLIKKAGYRKQKIILILLLFLFSGITGGSPSVVRAVIMSSLGLVACLIHRKSDTINNIAISAFLILLHNPYNLFNLGFQLSFLGTLGIVLFHSRINFKIRNGINCIIKYIESKNINMPNLIKIKLIPNIESLISVSISANLLIFPVIMYNYNKISFIFLISNLLVTPILAVLIFSGYITAISSFVSETIAFIPAKIFNFFIDLFQKIASFSSNIDFFKRTIGTPKVSTILFIYILIFFVFYNQCFNSKLVRYLKKLAKVSIIILIINFMLFQNQNLYNSVFTIHFVDVGQGDATLIITSSNKKILIDGGGSETGNFDVGKRVLVPYLLDRKITKIDYLIFSHFDSDHCQGLFAVMNELKVKNAVVSEQIKESENYKTFLKLAQEKQVKVLEVKAGNKLKVDNSTCIQFLWPKQNQLSQNPLNNNSVVCKIFYKNISILFTGDIEAIAEKEMLGIYKNELKADMLKVAHHGSITSSTEEFLNAVEPRIALIGVGANNKFGHPSDEVIERLNSMRCKNF
jgi:competence protein ComEC